MVNLAPHRTTLRGLTSGTVKTLTHEVDCWIFLDHGNLDLLIAVLTLRSLSISRIYVKSSVIIPDGMKHLIRQSGATVVPWSTSLPVLQVSLPTIGLFNFRVSRSTLAWLRNCGIYTLLSTVGLSLYLRHR